jgi:predicted nuclease of predicted toxin-antitoxin system
MPNGLKLYLDQMFGVDVAAALRREGHDVSRAAETGLSRADDALILERAIREERILVTLDEHFGDWVILPLKKHPGVIRLKVNPATTANVVNLLLPFLTQNGHILSFDEVYVAGISNQHSSLIIRPKSN